MSLPKDMGERGKDRERGARPKVRQSRSEERREAGGERKGGRRKKKGLPSQGMVMERPVSDGFEYGDQLGGLMREGGSSSPARERRRWPGLGGERSTARLAHAGAYGASLSELPTQEAEGKAGAGGGSGSGSSNSSNSGSRTLRQKIQDAVGQCFPIKSHSTVSSAHIFSSSPVGSSSSSSSSSSASSSSSLSASSRRKIHLSELMLDSCPFPAGSELAQKWYLIKQHTAPISQPPLLESSSLGGSVELAVGSCAAATASGSAASGTVEDEDDLLRERRRISIEQGVEPPPNAQIHTFEVTAEINPLYKLGPKLAHGMNELAVAASSSSSVAVPASSCSSAAAAAVLGASSTDLGSVSESSPSSLRAGGSLLTSANADPAKPKERFRVHTQIDYIHCLVPDLLQITNLPCYWGVMDRYQAEALLEGKPEGTFLLRDSAQEDYLFSVSFRRYGRSLHARIEQWNHNFSFDVHDPSVFHAPTVTGLLEHYKDPNSCMFFEPLLSTPVHRTQPFSLQHICRAVVSNHTTYDGIGALPIPNALKEHLKEYHYKQRVRVRRLDTWWE
ncbi:hypothetical protein AALO_G00199760 [Alosa alosa]|uniref:Suppressor of cytokine signaling 5 n=1 Tax=Alosa alosa TaxID=278164 RepID=A0AAV6G2E4_9TELE|nr:hypothetical protein AALO_G00199760 [Alosa alosa]